MRVVKRILVPVDYSSNSKRAIRWGSELAQRVKARLYFLNVDESKSSDPLEENTFGGLRQGFVKDEKLRTFIQEHCGLETPFLLSGVGYPATVIVTAVDLLDIDLLVMGTHGLHPSEMLLGTSSAAAMANTDCWVLLLNPESEPSEGSVLDKNNPIRVLAASSLSPQSLPLILDLHRLVYAMDGKLTIVHVEQDARSEERKRSLEEYLREELGAFANWSTTMLIDGDPVERILDQADRLPADIIAIGAGAVKGWERFIPGSVTRKILKQSHTPVLLLKQQIAVEEIFERCRRLAKNIDESILTGGDDDDSVGFDDLFDPSAKESNLLLGYYSKSGLEKAFQRYGFFRQLTYQGFREVSVVIDTKHPIGHRLRIRTPHPYNPEEIVDLVDLVVRKIVIPAEKFRPRINTSREFQGLSIEWICMQDPHLESWRQVDHLPGQKYSGLGVGREILVLLMLAAQRLKLDALLANPMNFYNAYIYSPYFRFIDAEFEGQISALRRDTNLLTLSETSKLLETKNIVDQQGEPFTWIAQQQILPLDQELVKHFNSPEYNTTLATTKRRYRFTIKTVKS